MKLWLVCFVVLFLGAEGLQWLGQMPGLADVDLSWPWIVLGGMGLAIASNYRYRQPRPIPLDVPRKAAPVEPVAATAAPKSASTVRSSSISFEIQKPQP